MNTQTDDIVGIIPAAGFANRINHIRCSKEIYPISYPDGSSRVVSSYLMECMQEAGAQKAYMILRAGKWDIPEYFKKEQQGLNLAFLVSEATNGVPFTIDKAYPFIKEKRVLLGFPDMLIKPTDIFVKLLNKQKATNAEIVLGLFKTERPEKADMIDFDANGKLKDIIIKQDISHLTYTWVCAVWTSTFTDFMHEFLQVYDKKKNLQKSIIDKELHIGEVIQEAINIGIPTSYVKFKHGQFLDIGTPQELEQLNNSEFIKNFSN